MTYLILFVSVAIGVIAVLLFKPEDRHKIRLLTAFSGAYVFTITVLHLFPEVYESHKHGIGFYILAGFFLQIALEYVSQGIEHGHAHHHHHGIIPWGVIVGLCVHAFLEGIPLGGGDSDPEHVKSRNMLLAGIFMHNVPVSVVLMTMLLHNEIGRTKALWLMLIFAAMSPLGALSSNFWSGADAYHEELTAVVIGIFLHLSTTILFETSDAHRFNRRKIVAIAIGTGLAMASEFMH